MKKNTPGMDFEAHSDRLVTLHEYFFDHKPKKIDQKIFQAVNESMVMKPVRKTQFAGLNDKRYHFHDGIVSLPFGHFLLEKTREKKEKHRSEFYTLIHKNMFDFLGSENRAVHLCERVGLLRSIYAQPPTLHYLNSQVLVKSRSLKSTRELILN